MSLSPAQLDEFQEAVDTGNILTADETKALLTAYRELQAESAKWAAGFREVEQERDQLKAAYERGREKSDRQLREIDVQTKRADTSEAKWAAAQAEIVKLLNTTDGSQFVDALDGLRKVVE